MPPSQTPGRLAGRCCHRVFARQLVGLGVGAAFAVVMVRPDVREKIAGAGIDVDYQDAAQLTKTIDAEIKKWALWVKAANITAE